MTEIDERDISTPDDWIPRHHEMIRLTGRHPFNSEPPLNRLFDAGKITSNAIHYVRNHGSVPQLRWETHKMKVCGLVKQETEFCMDDLVKLPSISKDHMMI